MNAVVLVLLIASAILALLATIPVAARFNLLAAAFLCFILATLIPALAAL